jgi:hypothetical protein
MRKNLLRFPIDILTMAEAMKIMERRPDLKAGSISVAYCPERVLPGRIRRDPRQLCKARPNAFATHGIGRHAD